MRSVLILLPLIFALACTHTELSYYADGTLESETSYKNGKVQVRKSYSPDMLIETYYNNGMPRLQKTYIDGQLELEIPYVNGKKHGISRSYDSGKYSGESYFENGMPTYSIKLLDGGIFEQFYVDGKLRQHKISHEQGIAEISFIDGIQQSFKLSYPMPDGRIITVYTIGDVTEMFSDFEKISEMHRGDSKMSFFKNDELWGEVEEDGMQIYRPEGTLQLEIEGKITQNLPQHFITRASYIAIDQTRHDLSSDEILLVEDCLREKNCPDDFSELLQ